MRIDDPSSTVLGRRSFLRAGVASVAAIAAAGCSGGAPIETAALTPANDSPHDPALLHPPIAELRAIRLPLGASPALVFRAVVDVRTPHEGR